MKKVRQCEQYIINECKKNIIRNRVLRQREEYTNNELAKNLARNRVLRKNKNYKCQELANNVMRNKILRRSLIYTRNEIQRNIDRNKKLRMNIKYKMYELLGNIKRMRIIRHKKDYRDNEKMKDRKKKQKHRKRAQYRLRENINKAKARKENREIDVLKFRDNLYNKLLKNKDVDPMAQLKLKFIQFRSQTPSFVCCCCEGLFFKSAVVNLNEDKIIEKSGTAFLSKINNFPSNLICNTCKNYAYRGEVHKLSTSIGLNFTKVPQSVSELTDLEERMLAPILNFMQIRALKPYALNPQLGLKGSVVNIQIDVNDILQVLPRKFDEMHTIQIKLKRHVDHKSDYMFESVRPKLIFEALNDLITTPLYQKYDIKVDENYLKNHKSSDEEINFILDNDDIVNNVEKKKHGELKLEELIDFDQVNNDEVLLMDNNALAVEEYAPTVNIIAPGQNKRPLPWHKIEDLDELCFPKIFAGHSFNVPECVSYSDRCKSEVRRYDRRSCIPSRILFMAKKNLEMSCLSSINICLRRTKKYTDIKAQDVLNPDFVNEIMKFDDGYKVLKYIRSSPTYWEQKKKEILAMIRQLGKPTFFLTLSAAEHHWPELLQTLMKYSKNSHSLSVKEAYELDLNTKTNLIRNDPIMCARYFDHKVHKFMWLLRQQHGIFGKYVVVDSYERVEFQQRGSPHEHILLWLDGSPTYDDADERNNQSVVDFIDQYLTCRYNENNPYIKFQMHKHNHSCYKGQKTRQCRFHIPYPIMRVTMILKPLNIGEVAPKSYKSVDELMNKFYTGEVAMNYDEALKELKMTEDEYILAIRSTLKQTRVFLRRRSHEVGINSYNEDILQLFESNLDLQFILYEYAVISYVTNYVSKVEGGLSKLLRAAAKDCDNNMSIKEKFRKISNVFLNGNLMSAQEAAYHTLSLSLSKKSRKVIFINTGRIAERVLMLKCETALKQLNKESAEIYVDDVFEKYCKRKSILDKICLADFASNYKITKIKKTSQPDDINDEVDEMKEYAPREQTGIIRYRRYKLKQDPINYYREKILLFMPWRNEKEEVENIDHETVYKNNKGIIEINAAKFSIISDETISEVLEQVENDNLIKENEECQTSSDDENSLQNIDILPQGGEESNINELIKNNPKKNRFTCPARVKENELHDMMRQLNCRQKEFVMHVLNCYKLGKVPFKIFLNGSAGVGKSTVINTLYQIVTNHFDNIPGGNMDKVIVLLCAPSGKAAFLINGVTLHSAFALPCNYSKAHVPQLSADLANNIREKLSKLQLLVIDEISMVGSTMLSYIDVRLRQINGVNQSFGGISVLVVGDLNQLPPVRDKPVYQVSTRNEMAAFIDINPLWNDFEFYELTEIMRQKDDLSFINALNNLALGEMSEEDIKLIKSRQVINDKDVPETAIRLYATNANVLAYNVFKISKCKSELVVSTAENTFSKVVNDQEKQFILQSLRKNPNKTGNELLAKIELKINIKYMIINNIDVEDGLVNGACGVLRLITFKENTRIPSILWFDFQLPRVGIKARASLHEYMINKNIDSNLTPISKVTIHLNMYDSEKYQIIQKQFPVMPAEAITVHKSQGQTYDKICLDFTKRERRSSQMLYVALSRVTKLDGLYILGEFKMSTSKNSKVNPALIELTRLRNTRTLILSYNNLINENGLIIVYQNVGTLKNKLDHILSDSWFLRSDILILSETLQHNDEKLNIANYQIVLSRNFSTNSRGLICYAKDHLPVEIVSIQSDFNSTAHFELILLKVRDYYVLSGYKSPKATKIMFEKVCQNIMGEIPIGSKIILIGDFNYNILNYEDQKNNFLINHLYTYNLHTKLPSNSVTTNYNTQIDVIFANFEEIKCGVYETYFSYHKPIYAIVDSKSSLKNRSEIIDEKKNEIQKKDEQSKIIQPNNNTTNATNCDDFEVGKDINRDSPHQYMNNDYNYAITAENCNNVMRYDCYLQDQHVNFFHEILNRSLNERGIFNLAQDTGYVRAFLVNLQEIPRDVNNIQIIYSGEIGTGKIGHWICTKSDGNGNIHIYDSLNCNYLNKDQIDYLEAIYKFQKTYIFHKVQSQTNGIDCGAFSIYFALLLSYNKDPSKQKKCNVQSIRNHISQILLTRQLLNFLTDE